MIEEADFQKIGNAAIDLCVFVDKLRLGEKHREEADKLTHNVLNLIKQTKKIEEEPLTKGNKMKKLKIQFWKAEKALAMQVLEQEGLPDRKNEGLVHIESFPWLYKTAIELRGEHISRNSDIVWITFDTQYELNVYLHWAIKAITDELFTGKRELKVGEMCEVRDDELNIGGERKLIAILPDKYDNRFIVEVEGCPTMHSSWNCARPITKRIEPTVEECGSVVTCTWEEK